MSSRARDRAAIESTLVTFITEDLGWAGDPAELVGPAGASLTEVLDSQDLIETAGFAEDEFGVEIDNGEITQHNFGLLDSVVTLIEAKLATAAVASD